MAKLNFWCQEPSECSWFFHLGEPILIHDIFLLLQILKHLASIWNVFESFRDLGEIFYTGEFDYFCSCCCLLMDAISSKMHLCNFHVSHMLQTFVALPSLPAAYRITQKCCIPRMRHILIKNQIIFIIYVYFPQIT